MSGLIGYSGARSGVLGQIGDIVLLRTHTATGTSWEVKVLFTREFRSYQFVWHNFKMATDNTHLKMQYSVDNGSNWISASNYHTQGFSAVNGGTTYPFNSEGGGDAQVAGLGNQGASGNEGGAMIIWVFDPLNPTSRKYQLSNCVNYKYDAEICYSGVGGSYQRSDATNAVKFYPAAGAFDNNNDDYNHVSVYGYRWHN